MKSILILAAAAISTSAFALDIPLKSESILKELKRNARTEEKAANYDFEGIVKLSNCSGSLIILNGMPTSAKGIVMTNGHCIEKPGYLKAGEVVVNERKIRSMKLFKSLNELHPIRATKILYATMTDTDVAYYELDQSYDEIKKAYNVDPLELSVDRPALGTRLELLSGYWDRGWTCNIDAFIYKMREGVWTWNDSIRYTPTCDTMGGTSGSPLIEKSSRLVIGINNTGNEGGTRCSIMNPCEVDEDGNITATKDTHYGQQTYPLYTCLRPDFAIDLTLPGCDLPK